jgi:hypothetical protein
MSRFGPNALSTVSKYRRRGIIHAANGSDMFENLALLAQSAS